MIFLNFLSVIALLLSYISGFISPAKITFPAYFGLGYIVIALINLIFVAIWSFFRPKYAIINLIILLTGWNLFWGHVNFNIKPSKINQEPIGLLSYNTHNFILHHPDSSTFKNYKNDIIEFVKNNNADIACFQEFFYANYKDSLRNDSIIKKLNYPYHFYASYQFVKKYKSMDAIATFSRYPIIKKAVLLNAQNEVFAIYTDIVINEDTNRLFNLHLTSIKLGNIKDSIQEKSVYKIGKAFRYRAKEVNYLKSEIYKSPYPVLICGDFNDTPASYTYQQLIKKMDDTYNLSDLNIANTYFWNLPPIRIDYILINKNYKTIYYKVYKLPFSDHYPVTSKIIKN